MKDYANKIWLNADNPFTAAAEHLKDQQMNSGIGAFFSGYQTPYDWSHRTSHEWCHTPKQETRTLETQIEWLRARGWYRGDANCTHVYINSQGMKTHG